VKGLKVKITAYPYMLKIAFPADEGIENPMQRPASNHVTVYKYWSEDKQLIGCHFGGNICTISVSFRAVNMVCRCRNQAGCLGCMKKL